MTMYVEGLMNSLLVVSLLGVMQAYSTYFFDYIKLLWVNTIVNLSCDRFIVEIATNIQFTARAEQPVLETGNIQLDAIIGAVKLTAALKLELQKPNVSKSVINNQRRLNAMAEMNRLKYKILDVANKFTALRNQPVIKTGNDRIDAIIDAVSLTAALKPELVKKIGVGCEIDNQHRLDAINEMTRLQTVILELANCGVDLSVPDKFKLTDTTDHGAASAITPARQSTIDRAAALKLPAGDLNSAHDLTDDFLAIKKGVGKNGKHYITIDDSRFTYRFNGQIDFVITTDDTGKLTTLIKFSPVTVTPGIKLKATSGYFDRKTGAIRPGQSTLQETVRNAKRAGQTPVPYLKASFEYMKARRKILREKYSNLTGMASQSVTGWNVNKDGKATLQILPFTAVYIYRPDELNISVELHIGTAIYSEPLKRLQTDRGVEFTATVHGADYNPATQQADNAKRPALGGLSLVTS